METDRVLVMHELETLEKIITGYAGWFANNVINHQMKILGIQKNDYTIAEIKILGEKVISAAIYDTKLQEDARNELRKAFSS